VLIYDKIVQKDDKISKKYDKLMQIIYEKIVQKMKKSAKSMINLQK